MAAHNSCRRQKAQWDYCHRGYLGRAEAVIFLQLAVDFFPPIRKIIARFLPGKIISPKQS